MQFDLNKIPNIVKQDWIIVRKSKKMQEAAKGNADFTYDSGSPFDAMYLTDESVDSRAMILEAAVPGTMKTKFIAMLNLSDVNKGFIADSIAEACKILIDWKNTGLLAAIASVSPSDHDVALKLVEMLEAAELTGVEDENGFITIEDFEDEPSDGWRGII